MHPKGANSTAVSGLGLKKALVGTGLATSLLVCTNGLRKLTSHFVGNHFWQRSFFPSLDKPMLTESKLINEWVWFELRMCRGWLQGHLCAVLGLKPDM